MARHRSRRYQKGATQVERNKRYPLQEGIDLIKSIQGPKFDESVELAVRIGIDPKKTDQLVRGSVTAVTLALRGRSAIGGGLRLGVD